MCSILSQLPKNTLFNSCGSCAMAPWKIMVLSIARTSPLPNVRDPHSSSGGRADGAAAPSAGPGSAEARSAFSVCSLPAFCYFQWPAFTASGVTTIVRCNSTRSLALVCP